MSSTTGVGAGRLGNLLGRLVLALGVVAPPGALLIATILDGMDLLSVSSGAELTVIGTIPVLPVSLDAFPATAAAPPGAADPGEEPR